jgi:hypothetical protein
MQRQLIRTFLLGRAKTDPSMGIRLDLKREEAFMMLVVTLIAINLETSV